MDDTQAKNTIYRELNNTFGSVIKKNVFDGQIDLIDNSFQVKTNKNFDLFTCKNGEPCNCIANVSKDGYFIQCQKCDRRLPITNYLPNTQKMNDSLVIIGIQINNSNNYEAPVSLQETYITYPLNHSLFNDVKRLQKFQKILKTHDLKSIVNYYSCKYTYIPQHQKWVHDFNYVEESEVFEDMSNFYDILIENLCSFYRENDTLPIINYKCYNTHILINLSELYRVILAKENEILPILRHINTSKEYIQVLDHTINTFLKKLYPKKGAYMKIDTIYEAYIQWMNLDTTNYIDKVYTKRELKVLIEEHLEKHIMFEYKKYRQYMVKAIRLYCFKDIDLLPI
jgi:hypothetical protein